MDTQVSLPKNIDTFEACVESSPITFESGSGNVFADMGLKNPETCRLKAHFILAISTAIKERGLTEVEAAQLLQINRSRSQLVQLRRKFVNSSIETLLTHLNRLGLEVEVREREKSAQA
jgi:predicted XRE-type DNA-binding protein